MDLKEFFRITIGIFALFIFLFVIIHLIWYVYFGVGGGDYSTLGFPLPFYEVYTLPCAPEVVECNNDSKFNFLFLIIDILVVYLLTRTIATIFSRIKE